MKSALIRADGIIKIGMGHLTREIDIANELKNINYYVIFLAKNYLEGISLVKENRFKILKLKSQDITLYTSIRGINKLISSYKKSFNLIIVDFY